MGPLNKILGGLGPGAPRIDAHESTQPTHVQVAYSVNTFVRMLQCAVAFPPNVARLCGSQFLPSECCLCRVDGSFHVAHVTLWNGRPDAAGGRVEAVQTTVVDGTAELAVDEVLNVDQCIRRHQ